MCTFVHLLFGEINRLGGQKLEGVFCFFEGCSQDLRHGGTEDTGKRSAVLPCEFFRAQWFALTEAWRLRERWCEILRFAQNDIEENGELGSFAGYGSYFFAGVVSWDSRLLVSGIWAIVF